MHDGAIKIKGALSWTTNREVAEFFANRFRRGDAEIWEIDVSVEDNTSILFNYR